MFAAEAAPAPSERPRWRTVFVVTLLLFALLAIFGGLFPRHRYAVIVYILGTAIALFLPIPACRWRLAVRALIFAALFTPNLVIGHGIFVLPAWRTLVYPMIPGIVPLIIAAAVLDRVFLSVHRAQHRDHPQGAACRRSPPASRGVTVAAVVLLLCFLPFSGLLDRARFASAYFDIAASAQRTDVSFADAAFVAFRLKSYAGHPVTITQIYRTPRGNVEAATITPAGEKETWVFIGGARGAMAASAIVTPEGPPR